MAAELPAAGGLDLIPSSVSTKYFISILTSVLNFQFLSLMIKIFLF